MAEIIKSIGRYQIIRPLGQGAMGTVFMALDPILKRYLAIKVVRAEGEERDNALHRFKDEAEISAKLNHPNTVTIYDVGEEPGVGPFLAMELVEGQTLSRLIQENCLDLESKLSILIQAMRALRAAHRHAIIHRDVKPENIQVGEDGRVKLMDFGIAKTMKPVEESGFFGSPAYAAPELLKGHPPTPSSDRYAFGVTAFELLTGALPHPGNNVAAVINHVLHEPIVIPHGISAPLANVFRKALATDPDNRYDNLMDFLTAIIDASLLDDGARFKVEELFHHDDHAGDIVPIRRKRPTSQAYEPSRPSMARTNGAARSTAINRNIKIELEPGKMPQPTRHTLPPAKALQRKEPEMLHPMTLLKWILWVIVIGPIAMYLWDMLKSHAS